VPDFNELLDGTMLYVVKSSIDVFVRRYQLARTTISVTCRADERYRDALHIIARRRGVSLGDLVRAALDHSNAKELNEIEAALFDVSDDQAEVSNDFDDDESTRRQRAG